MRGRFFIAGLAALMAASLSAVADKSAVTILFHVRSPYSEYDSKNDVTGVLVAPVRDALAKAGIHAEWVEMPPARQTEEIKRGNNPTCGLGWFKRPDREAFAKFTKPIYRDRPIVIVTRKSDRRFPDGMSLQETFRDPSRRLIVKTAYSYGGTIDQWIEQLYPTMHTSSGTNQLLLGMVAQERADYAIMAPEEAKDLLASIPELGSSLHAVKLSDAPHGELRYLMCSNAVAPDFIRQFNKALDPLAY
jgi:polar amino acid transport system substrate-binding protein